MDQPIAAIPRKGLKKAVKMIDGNLSDRELRIAYQIVNVLYSSDDVQDWTWVRRIFNKSNKIKEYILTHEDPYVRRQAQRVDQMIDSWTNVARNSEFVDENMRGYGLGKENQDYCVKCKASTENSGDTTIVTTKNNRQMRKSTCKVCGSTKARIVG